MYGTIRIKIFTLTILNQVNNDFTWNIKLQSKLFCVQKKLKIESIKGRRLTYWVCQFGLYWWCQWQHWDSDSTQWPPPCSQHPDNMEQNRHFIYQHSSTFSVNHPIQHSSKSNINNPVQHSDPCFSAVSLYIRLWFLMKNRNLRES